MLQSYRKLVHQDLQLMWSTLNYINSPPRSARWVRWFHERVLMRVVSKHPWRDIVAVIWLAFAIGCAELKAKHFWTVVTNLAACCALRLILEAKRPVEYDIRLQPFTDTNAMSYGFPSIESYMGVVIFGHMLLHMTWGTWQHALLLLFSVALLALIGLSRVWSRSRFPHQILGSWCLGMVGLYFGKDFCEGFKLHLVADKEHTILVMLAAFCFLINFFLSVENNDSRVAYVPKKEFVKVMGDIINGGSKDAITDAQRAYSVQDNSNSYLDDSDEDLGIGGGGGSGGGGEKQRDREFNKNRKFGGNGGGIGNGNNNMSGQKNDSSRGKKIKRYVKSDSLYFLQRQMQARNQASLSGNDATDKDTGGDESSSGPTATSTRRRSRKDGARRDAYEEYFDNDTRFAGNIT